MFGWNCRENGEPRDKIDGELQITVYHFAQLVKGLALDLFGFAELPFRVLQYLAWWLLKVQSQFLVVLQLVRFRLWHLAWKVVAQSIGILSALKNQTHFINFEKSLVLAAVQVLDENVLETMEEPTFG